MRTIIDTVVSAFVSRETLAAWRSKNQWLEMTEVRRETTNGIRVTVIPFYVGRQVRCVISYELGVGILSLLNLGRCTDIKLYSRCFS